MKYLLMMCLAIVFSGSAVLLQQTAQLKTAEWLIGTWENQTPRGTVYEQWEKDEEGGLSARSFAVVNGDTLIFETIRLIEQEDGLHYIPTVRNQNQGLPVVFKSEKLSAGEMIFSNPKHDFPQFISYTRTAPDSLVAAIYGSVNGEERRVIFPMRKIK
jgi:hypothetical protein